MAIDFPNSPTTNQTYTLGSTTWTYDGEKWLITTSGRTGPNAVMVSDSAPSTPSYGTLWYNSTNGKTYTYYTDVDSSQWVEIGNADPTFNTLTTKGDILTRSSSAMTRLPIGSNGQRLVSDSTQTTGLGWIADTTNTVIDAKGDLLAGTSADVLSRVPVGTNDYALIADSTAAAGVSWQTTPKVVANTASRPSSPYVGQVIYQTDTSQLLIWNGSSWVLSALATAGMGVWSSYSPSWTSNGTAPSVGNASLTGKYCRIGNTVFADMALVTLNGGSTSFGSGTYFFSLPVAAKPLWGYHSLGGAARIWDQSAQTTYICNASFYGASAGATTVGILLQSSGNWVQSGNPMTFAGGDEIQFSVFYEAN